MGSFSDIVRSRRGRLGRIDRFEIGLWIKKKEDSNIPPFLIRITFSESASQPVISNIRYEFDSTSYFDVNRNAKDLFLIKTPYDTLTIESPNQNWGFALFQLDRRIQFPVIDKLANKPQDPTGEKALKYISELFMASQVADNYSDLLKFLMPYLPNLILLAPLRSKPKRTYDPVQETLSPDGSHIPMLMMRLNRTEEREWRSLHDSLTAFGRHSGMFSDINVRRLGKQMSDPFQLQIKARSRIPANIMDVGYGVSQSLPILVDIHSHQDSIFLLQQPEVHLHPRAQAELATVFVESVRENRNSFMIETHSDHIVDRMRILVRQGKIPAEDVSILYFEPVKNAVQIHNIEVDGDGNLENVPPGYRDFFLRESDRLLGFED